MDNRSTGLDHVYFAFEIDCGITYSSDQGVGIKQNFIGRHDFGMARNLDGDPQTQLHYSQPPFKLRTQSSTLHPYPRRAKSLP